MPRTFRHVAVVLAALSVVVGAAAQPITIPPVVAPKTVYKIHGMTPYPPHLFSKWFKDVFVDYLNREVGNRTSPAITFELSSESFETIFESAEKGNFDFVFTFPNMAGCLEAEFNAIPLVTLRNLRQGHELNRYGGVIFTKKSRTDINSVQDLKGKIITATNILLCQHQWRVFKDAGVSMFGDPAQVRFYPNEKEMTDMVLSGESDAGFTKSDIIEDLEAKEPEKFKGVFKVLNQQENLEVEGRPFPFQASSQLYPENGLLAMPWVSQVVQREVMQALMRLNRDSPECIVGNNAGWQPALSYGEARDLYTSLGLMKFNEKSQKFQCIRATLSNYYSGIECGEGEFKKSQAQVESGCRDTNQTCPEPGAAGAFTCICKPCVKGSEVELSLSRTPFQPTGCQKMQICPALSLQQKQKVTFHARDNLLRDSANFTVRIRDPVVRTISGKYNGDSSYTVSFVSNRTGTHLMQFFVGGVEAPDSPFLIKVGEANCTNGRVPDQVGDCYCPSMTVEIAGSCVSLAVLNPSIIAPALFFGVMLAFGYGKYKHKAADNIWKIKFKDLKFPATPEILGIGTFGVVIRTEYYGTNVAVKRVVPVEASSTPGRVHPRLAFNTALSYLLGDRQGGSNNGSEKQKVFSKSDSHFDLHPGSRDPFGRGGLGDNSGNFSRLGNSGRSGNFATSENSEGSWQREPMPMPMSSGASPPTTSDTQYNASGLASSRKNLKLTFSGPSESLQDGGGSTSVKTKPQSGRLLKEFKATLGFSSVAQRNKSLQKDFVAEMRLLARLRHPCIISVMGAVVEKGQELMLVMELMEHGSLYDLIHNETLVMEPEITLGILRDMVQGIRFLHSNSPCFIHGDLKAANILIDIRFGAKVADFGLSQKKRLGATGTPFWMAPELLAGDSNTTASDIYSLGVTIWEIVSRQVLYQGENPKEALEGVLNGKRPIIPATASEDITCIIEACWHSIPAMRPTASEIDEQIRAMEAMTVMIKDQVKSKQYSKAQAETMRATQKTDELLYSIFPRHIADTLKSGGKVDPQQHSCVSIFFSDIVGFTDLAAKMDPLRISRMLDRLYSCFDGMVERMDVFKVETIGDAYMATTNVVKDQHDHAERLIRFAIAAQAAASGMWVDEEDHSLGKIVIRIGINSGAVVSNVVGTTNPRYCLFGDAVNTASRMESNSKPNMIHISESCHDLVSSKASLMREFRMVSRGAISVKGKGTMKTWWVIPVNQQDGQGHFPPSGMPFTTTSSGGSRPRPTEQPRSGQTGMAEQVLMPMPEIQASSAVLRSDDVQISLSPPPALGGLSSRPHDSGAI